MICEKHYKNEDIKWWNQSERAHLVKCFSLERVSYDFMSESGDQMFAVKVITKALVKKKPFLQKYIDQEIEIMKKLEHKNIVKQELALDTTDFILIVLEFCDQGNLLTYQAKLPGKVFSL